MLVTSTSAGAGQRHHAGPDVHRDATELAVDLLALAGMEARAHVDAQLLHGAGDLHGRAKRLRRLAEGGEETVAGRVLLAAAEALQLGANEPSEARQQLAPAGVAELRRERGRADDVDEVHRGQPTPDLLRHTAIMARPAAEARPTQSWTRAISSPRRSTFTAVPASRTS